PWRCARTRFDPDRVCDVGPPAAPAVRLTVHVWPAPSLTVTVPPGVPTPGGLAATVTLIVTLCPTTDGFGVLFVIVVEVSALLTEGGSAARRVGVWLEVRDGLGET